VYVLVPADRWRAHELDSRECDDEEAAWLAILEMANARLCDLADAAEVPHET
jgi:hypothetical protein